MPLTPCTGFDVVPPTTALHTHQEVNSLAAVRTDIAPPAGMKANIPQRHRGRLRRGKLAKYCNPTRPAVLE